MPEATGHEQPDKKQEPTYDRMPISHHYGTLLPGRSYSTGGHTRPYDKGGYDAAISKHGSYQAGTAYHNTDPEASSPDR